MLMLMLMLTLTQMHLQLLAQLQSANTPLTLCAPAVFMTVFSCILVISLIICL